MAATSISRHRGASAVAVATLTFMLSALTIFVLLANGLEQAASSLEAKAQLVAYLKPSVDRSEAEVLIGDIRARWPQAQIQYVSPKVALSQFRQTSLGRSLSGAIEGNPLPASLDIRMPNPLLLNRIAARLSSNADVHNVVLNRDLTGKLAEIATVVAIAGTAVVLGLAILALIMVINTTHLSIEARREEIEVVRLVGATQRFVRNPLIVEGLLLGVAGAILATLVGLGIFLPVIHWVLAGSSTLGALLPITTSPLFVASLGAAVLAAGASIGAAGSYVSARRFARI